MSITEVPELREILHDWADALTDGQPRDFLRWRQRLGYDYGWRVTTEQDRVRILHHLLCAMWNGQVDVLDGEVDSPARIRISLRVGEEADEGGAIILDLRLFGHASSWGSLLRAYEDWVLADDEQVRRDFSEVLLHTRPDGVTGQPADPHVVFRTFVDHAGEQARTVDDMRRTLSAGGRAWADQLYTFWSATLPAALDMPFDGTFPIRPDLRQLYYLYTRGNDESGP
jgi:hypothetical protein